MTGVRPFIREIMEGQGFEEWTDAFNTSNIPETLLDKSFHILSPSGEGVSLNMNDQVINFEQQVSIFRKGFENPADAIDEVISDIRGILCEILSPAERVQEHLNVIFEGFTIEPLNADNDNSVKATITFNVQVAMSFGTP